MIIADRIGITARERIRILAIISVRAIRAIGARTAERSGNPSLAGMQHGRCVIG